VVQKFSKENKNIRIIYLLAKHYTYAQHDLCTTFWSLMHLHFGNGSKLANFPMCLKVDVVIRMELPQVRLHRFVGQSLK
jgi:hypothetical protein